MPFSNSPLGNTGSRTSLPASSPSLTAPAEAKARGNSLIALLPASAMYAFPEPSTATPPGEPSPEAIKVPTVCVNAFHSLIALLLLSAM